MEELILTGNLGNDPKMNQTASGKLVANFSLGVNAGKDEQGQRLTKWYECDAWDKQAEIVEKYLHKGRKVLVRGTPRADAYTSKKDGKVHAVLRMTVRTLEMLDSRENGKREDAPQSSSYSRVEVDEDVLPF